MQLNVERRILTPSGSLVVLLLSVNLPTKRHLQKNSGMRPALSSLACQHRFTNALLDEGSFPPCVLSSETLARLSIESLVVLPNFVPREMVTILRQDLASILGLRGNKSRMIEAADTADGWNIQKQALLLGVNPYRIVLPSNGILPERGENVAGSFLANELVPSLLSHLSSVPSISNDQNRPAPFSDVAELQYVRYEDNDVMGLHLDSPVGQPYGAKYRRAFSFILYLNSLEWEDGGALQVSAPIPDDWQHKRYAGIDATDDTPVEDIVDITPTAGTLVIFRSEAIPHGVQRCTARRDVIVGWLHRKYINESSELLACSSACALRALESLKPSTERLISDPFAAVLCGEALSVTWTESTGRSKDFWIDFLALRTRWIDDALSDPVPGQLVILGAGFDSRCYRLPFLEGLPVFEIDFPAVLDAKKQLLESEQPLADLRNVAADLLVDSWPESLIGAGFRPDQPSVWLLEGLTAYLSEQEINSLFEKISEMASVGSRMVASFVGKEAQENANQIHRYLIKDESQASNLLQSYGWHVKGISSIAAIAQAYDRVQNMPEDYPYFVASAVQENG